MKSSSILKILGVCAAVGGVLVTGSRIASNASTVTETVAMHALNSSGQNGTATITDVGGKVLVSVRLTGEPSGASEPAHVHFGRCPNIKAVPAYNVGPILHGKGSDIVQLTWAEINSGKYAVNVHKSALQMGTYVSCGNIGR